MDVKTTVGIGLTASSSIAHTVSSAVGIAETGTAIGTLHGAAHTSAFLRIFPAFGEAGKIPPSTRLWS